MTTYSVEYLRAVGEEDVPRIPGNLRVRIFRAIESRLLVDPVRYGVRLRRSLKGLWKLRIGDYRIVYEVDGARITVYAIQHRAGVYDQVAKRIRK